MEAIKKIKQNIKNDAQNAGLIFLGFVAGKAANYLIDLAIEDKPDIQTYIKPIKPFVITGAGLAISGLSEKDSAGKYIGFGIAGAGASEAIKLRPVIGDYAKTVLGAAPNDIPVYYTEGMQQIELGGFGISSIPIRNLTVQDANSFNPDLPDLEGVELEGVENIGANISGESIPYVKTQSKQQTDDYTLDEGEVL